MSQRIAYKKDFDACYPEYMDLHKYIEPIMNTFNSFDEKVKSINRNSPEFEVFNNLISIILKVPELFWPF